MEVATALQSSHVALPVLHSDCPDCLMPCPVLGTYLCEELLAALDCTSQGSCGLHEHLYSGLEFTYSFVPALRINESVHSKV